MTRLSGRQQTIESWRADARAVVHAAEAQGLPMVAARAVILRRFKAARIAPPRDVLQWATAGRLRDADDGSGMSACDVLDWAWNALQAATGERPYASHHLFSHLDLMTLGAALGRAVAA